MNNKVLFFGILEDVVGSKEIIISNINSSDELIKNIKDLYPELGNKTFQVSVNQQLINTNTTLNNGDEIALLPPFAGG
ncbi:MAG TPA: MoaD/ThiS family protein [Flavobacteriales bacterium]|nr:MoaD/ThiS family protein [Flavobacteriales bacterium]